MAEQENDLDLKKRARRRLVGAVAFAVLAVALLPTVMDEAPPRVAGDIAIRIPGQDETRPVPLAATPEPRPAPSVAPAEPPSAATGAELDGQKAERPKVDAPGAAESPKPAAKATPAPAEVDAKRAQSILEGRPNEQEYVLLIGAYANMANVTALTGKLTGLGIKTYTESVTLPQGKRTRVRAGPFETRAAAEAARDKMKRIGVSGQIAVRP